MFFALASGLYAQWTDDFADGNFDADPEWTGDGSLFIVNAAGQLQLQDAGTPAAGTAQLRTTVPTGDSCSWEWFSRLDFAPSTSNFARIYLASDQADLNGPLNGYYVRLGGISGNDDAIELFRQTGTNTALVLSGKTGGAAGEPVIARIRMTRNDAGLWRLWVDYTGGNDFVLEAQAIDATHAQGQYLGVLCKYTATRADKFLFDDFRVDPLFSDRKAPSLSGFSIGGPTQLNLSFDEPVTPESAEEITHYSLSGNVQIIDAVLDGDQTGVQLALSPAMLSGQSYTLSISGLEDATGNLMTRKDTNFTFIQIATAAPYDVLITEIMVDPSPVIGLPEVEYVELYNRSSKALNLQDLLLADERTNANLPAFVLQPQTYVALYPAGNADFSAFGPAVPVSGWPALTNTGELVRILDRSGNLIHAVQYSDDWYRNNDKAGGGWSLEWTTPDQVCSIDGSGWQASVHPNGGTPGLPNSAGNAAADSDGPRLLRWAPEGLDNIRLVFDEALTDPAPLSAFQLSGNNAPGILVTGAGNGLSSEILLGLTGPIPAGQFLSLRISGNVADCLGNSFSDTTIAIALPEKAEPGDVVINEVLFNPATGGSRFVELYNRSAKVVDVGDWVLASRDINGNIDKAEPVEGSVLLFPDGYLVLTENPSDILGRYKVDRPGALWMTGVPTYEDKKGTVVLYQAGSQDIVVLDEFSYDESFHFELLDDKNGVSLERIHPDAPTQSASNWFTAASTVGYATPTYRNSQFREAGPVVNEENLFTLSKETFSPDGDGMDDQLFVEYGAGVQGKTANLRIFDAEGRLIKRLVSNQLLDAGGFFTWDGVTDDGTASRIGIYILWSEVFGSDGSVKRQKQTFVLAGRL